MLILAIMIVIIEHNQIIHLFDAECGPLLYDIWLIYFKILGNRNAFMMPFYSAINIILLMMTSSIGAMALGWCSDQLAVDAEKL